ncbi:MAG: hypothetical protein ACE5GE_14185, partial [Phycisphaerae bacterium]
GPIASVPLSWHERLTTDNGEPRPFPDLRLHTLETNTPTTGQVGAVCLVAGPGDDACGVVLVDLPDVTSKWSADQGHAARVLLPWFDGLLVVADEERWFDAAVFDDLAELARNFGPRVWVAYNRTEPGQSLTPEQTDRLSRNAQRRHTAESCLIPFQPGRGYRPIPPTVRRQIADWFNQLQPLQRISPLRSCLQRRCAELVRANLSRAEQITRLKQDVNRTLVDFSEQTSLTRDLLTDRERRLLGVSRRLVPFYDALHSARRKVGKLLGWPGSADPPVDFQKRGRQLARVLRQNLEHRFGQVTARIDRIISDSPYVNHDTAAWKPAWSLPDLDENAWASRIEAQLDAWQAEANQLARRGDAAAFVLGMPLLLADLLFLGGAGLTLSWTAASLAGFLGGKGFAARLKRSAAFADYQTSVRAYQAFIREAITAQWEQNLADMPVRHLDMSDPLFQAALHFSGSTDRP